MGVVIRKHKCVGDPHTMKSKDIMQKPCATVGKDIFLQRKAFPRVFFNKSFYRPVNEVKETTHFVDAEFTLGVHKIFYQHFM